MGCGRCESWQRRRGAANWGGFRLLAGLVRADVEAGALAVLRADLPLDAVPVRRPEPIDGFADVQVWLACTSCGQQFLLYFKAEPPVGGWQPHERRRV